MAMRNEAIRTPDWLRVEISHDPRHFDAVLNIGVRCKDGWAHLVSLNIDAAATLYEHGAEFTKLRAYQRHHEFVTRKLATETLEKT